MRPAPLQQLAATEFYAGAGTDFIKIANGQNITIYGDASASDTAGGNDSLKIAASHLFNRLRRCWW